jgi:hypothetical protein
MSETVRDWLESMGPLGEELAADGNSLGFFVPQLLDATVYGLCATCGGSRVVPKPYGDDRDRGRTFSECPDCQRISIVTEELRERVDDLIASALSEAFVASGANPKDCERNDLSQLRRETRDAVLSTVLGKTEVVDEVVEFVGPSFAWQNGDGDWVRFNHGDRLFIQRAATGKED